MRQSRIAAIIALLTLACLTGCSNNSADTSAAHTTKDGKPVTMTPEQKQHITQLGQTHQAGGRIRSNVMHRTAPSH